MNENTRHAIKPNIWICTMLMLFTSQVADHSENMPSKFKQNVYHEISRYDQRDEDCCQLGNKTQRLLLNLRCCLKNTDDQADDHCN